MAVEKPIGFIPEQEEAIEQMVEVEGQQFADGLAPNIEMMEDGSAIIGEQMEELSTSFDMNLAETIAVTVAINPSPTNIKVPATNLPSVVNGVMSP